MSKPKQSGMPPSQISASNVSDNANDVGDAIMFKSACQVAKNYGNTIVNDYVHLKEDVKIRKGEREGISITLPNGETVRYLKL